MYRHQRLQNYTFFTLWYQRVTKVVFSSFFFLTFNHHHGHTNLEKLWICTLDGSSCYGSVRSGWSGWFGSDSSSHTGFRCRSDTGQSPLLRTLFVCLFSSVGQCLFMLEKALLYCLLFAVHSVALASEELVSMPMVFISLSETFL